MQFHVATGPQFVRQKDRSLCAIAGTGTVSGVEFFPRQSAKYFSRIDAKALLRQARNELAAEDSPAFLVVLVALAAGLRKGEIDTLCWHQIDFERGVIRVEHTDTASLKSADSRGEVPD